MGLMDEIRRIRPRGEGAAKLIAAMR